MLVSAQVKQPFDILVIGGGINGVGIAADAAGRGLRVLLCEQSDLGAATSSASSQLIHGGLRYLEHREFKLVRQALLEREVLMRNAPHLIHPLTFILPHNPTMRPRWVVRLGLWIYDYLAKRDQLAKSGQIDFRQHLAGQALQDCYHHGFNYTDCRVDDARLVIVTAQAARQHGAVILPRTRCVAVRPGQDYWQVELQDCISQQLHHVKAKAIVNAAGPWVTQVLREVIPMSATGGSVSLVKGSHIVVPKLYDGDFAFILQHCDRRVVFAMPYQADLTMIGTTDSSFVGDPRKVNIDHNEMTYLCDIVNQYFRKNISPEDIVTTWSGVRPLYDDGSKDSSKMTRDYHLALETVEQRPLLTVFGGKITTYRVLAEAVLAQLQPFFPDMGPAWTAFKSLPGGDMSIAGFPDLTCGLSQKHPKLPIALLTRYAATYGSQAAIFLKDIETVDDLGQHFGADLYAYEVDCLCQHEWARTADDILWRRTKLGLQLQQHQVAALEAFLQDKQNKQ